MGYAESVWERAMQVQEVIFRAMAGEIQWFRAADILGVSARAAPWDEHRHLFLVTAILVTEVGDEVPLFEERADDDPAAP